MSVLAISPVDGRYATKTSELVAYFSEFALIKYRVRVEVEYFIALSKSGMPQLSPLDEDQTNALRNIYGAFSEEDAAKIKDFERVTNHDVKAVEYFIKEKLEKLGLSKHQEFIHFGLTSQDINNTAVPMSVAECFREVYLPQIKELIESIQRLARDWKDIPMLARTHGQPASPTRLGKEMQVFADRLNKQVESIEAIDISGKFGGATGNFNAHHVAYPDIDWIAFANTFLKENLGIARQQTTTQIEHYDELAAKFDALKRINTILIDFCRDIWAYVSMNYFKQAIKEGEVGSSAMPHKVNPIDFENAEGNLGLASAILEHLAMKLPVSRLQRDLTDSTVLRNVGMPFGYILVAFKSLEKGIGKLMLNEDAIRGDLEKNWSVVAEAIQTILRREGYPKPYEALKDLTRTNEVINKESMHKFIEGLNVSDQVKNELRQISPYNYIGVQLVK